MKANFDTILEKTLSEEGGYADHPSDPGGATNMGITRKTLAHWRKIVPYTNLSKQEVKNLGKAEAKEIYRARYWNVLNCDLLPSGLDHTIFDYGVNSGPARAAKSLQGVVKTSMDGIIGNNTLAAVAERDVRDLINLVNDERMLFLKRLKTFNVFGKGWTDRVSRVRKNSLSLAEFQNKIVPKPSEADIVPDSKVNWLSIIIRVILSLLRGR